MNSLLSSTTYCFILFLYFKFLHINKFSWGLAKQHLPSCCFCSHVFWFCYIWGIGSSNSGMLWGWLELWRWWRGLTQDTHGLLAMDQDWIAEMFLRDLHSIIAIAAHSWWHTCQQKWLMHTEQCKQKQKKGVGDCKWEQWEVEHRQQNNFIWLINGSTVIEMLQH